MQKEDWKGIFPAITTRFHNDFSVDDDAIRNDVEYHIESGVHGLVACGSLGENGSLTAQEKHTVAKTMIQAVNKRIPAIVTVAECTTQEACHVAKEAETLGADGLMVLPGMRYVGDSREVEAHLRAVAKASSLPIMIYNNPVAYGMDVSPEMFARLADEPKFVAIKESSDDVRRVTDIIRLTGDRYRVFTGVDNLGMEAIVMGAVGWIAGLVCAFPKENVKLWDLLQQKKYDEALEIYRWFKPLLDLDVSTKLVQNIKLAEHLARGASTTVRPPRLDLAGEELEHVQSVIQHALKNKPVV